MKKHALLIPVACAALLSASCGNSDSGKDKAATQDSVVALKPVAISTVTPSPDFPGAALSIASVKAEKVGADSAKVSFAFDVKNYELKMQTSDNGTVSP